jgi:primary-amine oxidase
MSLTTINSPGSRIAISSPRSGLHHPLEPLTADEITMTVKILREGKQLGKTIRFVSVVLKEPSKEYVKRFSANGEMRREAFVVLFDNAENKCF